MLFAERRRGRAGRFLLSAFVAFACLFGPAADAAETRCVGTDILPKLKTAHPEIMKKVRAAADKIKNTEAILWRVEKPGLEPSYLFGTMHVSDDRIMTMPEAATKAALAAKTVALEIADMSPGAMMKAVQKVPRLMIYTDGSRLDEKLSEAEFKTLSRFLAKTGLPRQLAAVMRPWMISIMLAVPACERQRVRAGEIALDLHISALAKKQNIPIVGLETIQSQLRSMAGVPDADQISMLRVSLAFIEERDDLFETLIQAYVNRDLGMVLALSKGMAEIAGFKSSGFAAFSRELIAKRNHEMFDSSLPLADKGSVFIAVGAAHLIGETGLVALYRKAGFTVSAVE